MYTLKKRSFAPLFFNNKMMINKSFMVKYKCLLCWRYNFDKPGPHKCAHGYRKRGLAWCKYLVPDRIVMIEKAMKKNTQKFIINNLLKKYSRMI